MVPQDRSPERGSYCPWGLPHNFQFIKQKGGFPMPWYYIVALICVIVGPFDALYLHIKAQKRKEERKRREKDEKPN